MITVAVLTMAPVAHAASVLVTSALARGGVPFTCRIVNADKTDVDVTIEIVEGDGDVISTSRPTIVPGATFGLGRLANDGSSVLYCRFTLHKGSKNKVRASACAYSSLDTSGPCLSTAEAR
jgi:hypothetical protein